MSTTTTHLGMVKNADGEFGWQQDQRDNLDILDTVVGQLNNQNSLSGVATSGSATTLTDTGLSLGIDAYAAGVITIFRNGLPLRSERVISNTAQTITFVSGASIANGDTYSLYVGNSGVQPDANGEIVELPSGAAAQTAAGLGAGYKRANGTWATRAASLWANFPLQTWADNLVSGVVYDVNLSVVQNGLPTGWWHIEVLRHRGDQSNNQFRVIRATSFGVGNSINRVYQSTNANGAWTPFILSGGDVMLGVGQTWQDVTASRVPNTTYTNTTGRPIEIMVYGYGTATYSRFNIFINGASFNAVTCNAYGAFTMIIPNNVSYSYTITSASITMWWELR